MKKINKRILETGLVLCTLLCIMMYFLVYKISANFVHWNPELAYMQMPLYALAVLIITGIIVSLSIAFLLVHRSTKENIFRRPTVKLLYLMGHFMGFAFLMSFLFFMYAYLNLGEHIGLPGGFILIFNLITFVGTNVVYFVAGLFAEAVDYKEENQLTV